MSKETIEFYAECIRKGDAPEAVLRVAIADHNETLTTSEVEADFQGRHNRENLGNVIGWVAVTTDQYRGVFSEELYESKEAAEKAIERHTSVFEVFPVVRTL